MKRIVLFSLIFAIGVFAQAQPSARWFFTKERSKSVESQWVDGNNRVRATDFGDGHISISRTDESLPALGYHMKKSSPAVDGLRFGDAWEFTLNSGVLDAGMYVELDFSIVSEEASPRYYLLEYLDGSQWKTMPCDVLTEDGVDYSFKCFGYVPTPSYQYTVVHQTIHLENPVTSGCIRVRARVCADCDCRGRCLDSAAENSCTRLEWADNMGAYMNVLGDKAPSDTTNVLCIGNSFTYVQGAAWMLKEIAWSQGHYLNLRAALKGGQTFGQHLDLYTTDDAIRHGNYDVVFLQNQSQTNAWYAQSPKEKAQIGRDAMTLVNRVRACSPDARVVLESTWSYPGANNGGFSSLKQFDRLLEKGTRHLCRETSSQMSPIGRAFALCRKEYPDISLYAADDKHQSANGAYLKACVNYLLIFGEPFEGEVSDCHIDSSIASRLRSVASKVIK